MNQFRDVAKLVRKHSSLNACLHQYIGKVILFRRSNVYNK